MREKMLIYAAALTAAVLAAAVQAGGVDADKISSSRRSREAIERVRPSMQSKLDAKDLRYGSPIFIRIFKESKELELWIDNGERFELFDTYGICSFSGELGPKIETGDMQSPEGFYYVRPENLNPSSQFHLSFDIGYPNAYDRAHGRTGSALMVHGDCVSIGCYAMTDDYIEEIYALADGALRGGQPFFRVHIFPFRMTGENMAMHEKSDWLPFWRNLKKGYDFFEKEGFPPNVRVVDSRYIFEMTQSQRDVENRFASAIEGALTKLPEMKKEIENIHPLLGSFHPVAVLENDYLYIFDFDTLSGRYRFQKREPAPFPMPKEIRASFPLSSYNWKPSCIVSKNVFNTVNGYVLIFHEFIHCGQSETCEQRLKNKLEIARAAAAKNDFSWELNHPFPYQDSTFTVRYSEFIEALNDSDRNAIMENRGELKRRLSPVDFEYMVWQEWKEGFARLIENKIQTKYGVEVNEYGKDKPYDRVVFYHGGARFIDYLVRCENGLFHDIELLFDRMLIYDGTR
jgi:murein L,D-transpeptidase YafK